MPARHPTVTVLPPPADAPTATPLLAGHALACRRGERLLFSGLELAVQPGQVLWLRGANGRGKTSLLRLLAGLSTPESGEVRHGGAPLGRGGGTAGRMLHLAHANALKDDLTVLEALGFLARIQGLPSDTAALLAALERLGMRSRRHAAVRTLSQGQRRRVALARLALDLAAGPAEGAVPSVWILDEPYDALDTDGSAALDALIAEHAARGGAVVLTSHLPLALRAPVPLEFALDGVAA
jgi:heme exporter protein A